MEAIAQNIPDRDVVRSVLSGQKERYEILMRRYNGVLYRAIRSFLNDEQEVEDAMQETYLCAYEKLKQYRGEAAFSTWLIRIGINEALKRIRMKKRQLVYSGDTEEEKYAQIPDTMKRDPENIAIQNETRSQIELAIDSLPEKYRTVFMLREVEGISNEEIASCLDISGVNVKVRLHRAKSLLKETLSPGIRVFEFGNERCDNLVARVMNRIMEGSLTGG